MKDKNAAESITNIALSELHSFPGHPFGVRDDDSMRDTAESIKLNGVLTPIIVRPREEGGYEIISGHRRRRACELAGVKTIPAVIRDMTRDEAVIMMVDSNLQREEILPSERAQAYKMKMEAIKRQAGRPLKNSPQVAANFRSDDEVAKNNNVSGDTVRRYIRLTELKPELQQMVDEKKMAITPAVEISYLKPDEQKLLIDTMDSEQTTPSLSQAQRLKKLSQEGKLNDDTMLDIMMEQKKPEKRDVVLTEDILRKYFPRNYTPLQVQQTVIRLLDAWQKRRQQQRSEAR